RRERHSAPVGYGERRAHLLRRGERAGLPPGGGGTEGTRSRRAAGEGSQGRGGVNMCGIIAYTGKRQAAGILYEGLTRLEYRGYDSAGIALSGGQRICCVKRAGRVSAIADALTMPGNCGIGHTRWATHGG